MEKKSYTWPELNTKLTDVFDGIRGDVKELFCKVLTLENENIRLRTENEKLKEEIVATNKTKMRKEKKRCRTN